MAPRAVFRLGAGLMLVSGLFACPGSKSVSNATAPASSASAEAPLGDVTLQSGLEAAWDGDFLLCYKRARTAVSIASDDLESMELVMRCAHAQRALHDATSWVRSAYAKRITIPVVRYGLGLAALLRGELGEARKLLDKLEQEAPAAAFHAAIAAQLDDDVIAAEKHIALYAKSNPSDPAGRALQAEIVCALDLNKCNAILETVRSTDEDETAVARRLGAVISGPAVANRARLAALTRDADALQSAAFSDALAVATLLREGADPASILVRSPRSGRPEPGPSVDLVKQAKPIPRLPFATRVVQLASLNDPAASTAHSRMAALFPTEFSTWRLARRWERTAVSARKELERSPFTRWRAMVATVLARPDEFCELAQAFPWTDRGPIANSTRARCEIFLDAARGRKIAEARLAVLPFGQGDVETAIEGHAAMKDPTALETLGRNLLKTAPAATLSALALWASADAGAKKSHALFAEAVAMTGWDPSFSRRLLQRYVEAHDVPHAKSLLPEALVEAPTDAYLCGVFGEILLHEGKPADALPWLTKSCVSARARKEQDVLASTLSSLASAVAKAKAPKDKPLRDAALKCAKGE